MRKSNISLNLIKLSTHFSKLRESDFTTSFSVFIEDLYFFDFSSLFQVFLSAFSIRERLHFEMTKFHDNSSKYWHFRAWFSSIRTTSDQYVHSSLDKQFLFLFDFVNFKCEMLKCVCLENEQERHLKRIFEMNKNYRNHVSVKRVITLKIQRVLKYQHVFTLSLNSSMLQNELILTHDFFYVMKDSIIHDNKEIYLNYLFESRISFFEYSSISDKMTIQRFLDANDNARFLCRSHSIRVELKLKKFTRQHFIFNFDKQISRCLSLFLISFIDDFELYSNAYKSLMNIYFLMTAFFAKKKFRMFNVLLLILSSHDSNMTDVVNSLHNLFELDDDVWLKINEKNHFVCVFSLCYLENMLQQIENNDFKSQRNNISCRSCFVSIAQKDNLHFDVSSNERFHQNSCRMRREMNSRKIKHTRETFAIEWELNSKIALSLIEKLSFALDFVLSRFSNSIHSKYEDMIKLLHVFLVKAILHDNKSRHLYTNQLQRFSFSFEWNRLQSSFYHLESYTLSEHARWFIIASSLLRIWLREKHISSFFLSKMQKEFVEKLMKKSSIDIIVFCFAINVKSNNLLMHTHMTSKDQTKLRHFHISLAYSFSASLWNRRHRRYRQFTISTNYFAICKLHQDQNFEKENSNQVEYLHWFKRVSSTRRKCFSTISNSILERNRRHWILQSKDFSHSQRSFESSYRLALKRIYDWVRDAQQLQCVNERAKTQIWWLSSNYLNAWATLIYKINKWYKKIIYETNHRNVERILLKRENIQQILRLILLQFFVIFESRITVVLQRIQERCFSLFSSLLSTTQLENLKKNDEFSVNIIEDKQHESSAAQEFLIAVLCSQNNLSLRADKANSHFRRLLFDVYHQDYQMKHVSQFDYIRLEWCKQINFTNSWMI